MSSTMSFAGDTKTAIYVAKVVRNLVFMLRGRWFTTTVETPKAMMTMLFSHRVNDFVLAKIHLYCPVSLKGVGVCVHKKY